MVWGGIVGKEERTREQPPVLFVAVIDGETDVEKLAPKVVQLMELIEESDTKPDPDDKSKQFQGVE